VKYGTSMYLGGLMELTFKRETKELETSLEVIRVLIDVAKNQIKHEPKETQWKKELHQLYGVENLLEQAVDFYYKVDDMENKEDL
jgi:hypothetical protein|tara:strand:+ start:951 stop:1205 length:255 start_codon:yes stop_codon:yes gene_type:complete